jgi:hypothetical protein
LQEELVEVEDVDIGEEQSGYECQDYIELFVVVKHQYEHLPMNIY